MGSALLEYRLRAIDTQAIPAYLEATTPASRRLYERHGFQAAGSVDIAPGVSATAMTRDRTGHDKPSSSRPVASRQLEHMIHN